MKLPDVEMCRDRCFEMNTPYFEYILPNSNERPQNCWCKTSDSGRVHHTGSISGETTCETAVAYDGHCEDCSKICDDVLADIQITLCGSDGKRYKNWCELDKVNCERKKRKEEAITVLRYPYLCNFRNLLFPRPMPRHPNLINRMPQFNNFLMPLERPMPQPDITKPTSQLAPQPDLSEPTPKPTPQPGPGKSEKYALRTGRWDPWHGNGKDPWKSWRG